MPVLTSTRAGPHGIHPLPKRATRRMTFLFTVPLTQIGTPPGLPRLRHHVDLLEVQQRRIECGALFAPQRLAHLERVIEKATTPLELEPGRLVLFALPSDADAEIDASVRQDVERRQRLGQHDRAAQRGDENVRAEANAST